MPFSGPGDATLPDNVKELPENRRARWVEIWNSVFDTCVTDQGSDCEASAFRQANGVVFANQLQFVSNQIAKSERRTVDGIEFLVSPGVFVKPGVLNDELVPADEIATHFEAWNGRPFVINHPEVDGVTVSANNPDILASTQIGRMFNVRLDDGALKGEIWIDIKKAQNVSRGNEVMDRLENGKILEISTAYFRDRDITSGTHAGAEFSSITRNLRPDHLAALLDVEGACSWNDGCGAPRVNMKTNVLSTARKPSFQGTETIPWEDVTRTFQAYRNGFYRHTAAERPDDPPGRVQDAPQAMKDWIASKTLIGDPGADKESDLIAFPVVNPGTNRLNSGGVRGAIARAPQADIPEGAASSIQSVGRSLLESEFETEQASNESFVMSALKSIQRALGINQKVNQEGNNMDELVAAILKVGGLKASEEELSKLSQTMLAAILEMMKAKQAAAAEHLPEEGTPEVEQEETSVNEEPVNEDPVAANQQEPAAAEVAVVTQAAEPCQHETPATVLALAEALDKRGGLEKMLAAFDTLQADEDERKVKLVTTLAANAACLFSKDQLSQFTIETLTTLDKSLRPAFYSGQSGGETVANTKEQVYALPAMFGGN